MKEVNNPGTHYHVVEFINGCLNDYDSGPIDNLEDAVNHLNDIGLSSTDYEYDAHQEPETGCDRYFRGPYTLQIETCNQEECLQELEPFWFGGTTNEAGEVYGG